MDLPTAAALLDRFVQPSLTVRVGALEAQLRAAKTQQIPAQLAAQSVSARLLAAAFEMKRASAQIDVVIHALAIALLLPDILSPDESVISTSLGAGNTGRAFDLETDRRVAEFKFIRWQGGAEAIRQNSLFKDFFQLAEHETTKRKQVFVLGTTIPLAFLNGGRAISSVLSRNVGLTAEFRAKYGDRFSVVRDYYDFRRSEVEVVDVEPALARILDSAGGYVESTG